MKTNVKFLIVVALIGLSIALLLNMGVRANTWTGWIVLIALPTAGYIIGKTDFRSPE